MVVEPTKDEYLEWKLNDVTKVFFDRILERREDSKELLAMNKDSDPEWMRGYCQALLDILHTEFEDFQEN
jgi:hypothetical protein